MLTLQIVPYEEIRSLSSLGRIRKLLKIAKENKVVLLEGRLSKEEEAELIAATMEEIDNEFKGIELAVLDSASRSTGNPIEDLRRNLAKAILGNREGLTIIGPATVVKEIKKDPNKIQLMMQDNGKRRKKKRKK